MGALGKVGIGAGREAGNLACAAGLCSNGSRGIPLRVSGGWARAEAGNAAWPLLDATARASTAERRQRIDE